GQRREAVLDLGRVRPGRGFLGRGRGGVVVLVVGVRLVLVGVVLGVFLLGLFLLLHQGGRGSGDGGVLEQVEETDQQLGQALLAGLVQLPVLEDQLDGGGEQRQRGL